MSRLVFLGFPAWVGTITSTTKCKWWPTEPAQINFAPEAQVVVDLALAPSAALAGHIKSDQVEVDDNTSRGGRGTIGPLFPGANVVGACWLRDTVWRSLDSRFRPPFPPPGAGGFDYEFTTIQYLDNEIDNRRFYGFHARAVSQKANLTLVELWNPGTGIANPAPAGRWWLDIPAVTDPNAPHLDPGGKPGPLFVENKTVQTIAVFEPKFPKLVGSFAFPDALIAPAAAARQLRQAARSRQED